jgi:hypothetical protein
MDNLDSLTFDQLEELVADIVMKAGHTKEDCKVLSQIKFFMAREYRKRNKEGSLKEANYNGTRSSESAMLSDTMAVSKAEAVAKANAEKLHGTYREINADASGMSSVIKATE